MNHLNEDNVAALLINNAVPENDGLLCDECVADVKRTQAQLEGVRDDMVAAAARDEVFWARQRAAIRQRIRPAWSGIRLRWAAGMAALVAIAVLLIGSAGTPSREQAQSPQLDPDYVLLAEIQQTLARPVPNAVEPMRVLASDMDQAWRAHLQQTQNRDRSGERQ